MLSGHAAVNELLGVAIGYSSLFWNANALNKGGLWQFRLFDLKTWLPWQHSLSDRRAKVRPIICTKSWKFGEDLHGTFGDNLAQWGRQK